ncbi:MAG: EAL domain-containing protein, partial [Sulfurimonas sp.]|nr:EAL domain-containing protein [Sulfurimonas sp.]
SVLDRMLKDTGCKPEWLELEVTEGEIMKNPENAIKVLSEISNMGIELAIDDFGTGYSSLSYLKRLPIDKLKIDKSFVDGLPGDDEDVSITKAVIALAKSLKLNVLAEGVENKEQKEFLLENDCENIQGYFYAKPMSAVKMEIFLKEYS